MNERFNIAIFASASGPKSPQIPGDGPFSGNGERSRGPAKIFR
jgi:hypothetical protein